MVDGDVLAFSFNAVGVWDFDFVDGVFAESVTYRQKYSSEGHRRYAYPRPLMQAFLPSCQAYLCFSERGAGNLEIRYTALARLYYVSMTPHNSKMSQTHK